MTKLPTQSVSEIIIAIKTNKVICLKLHYNLSCTTAVIHGHVQIPTHVHNHYNYFYIERYMYKTICINITSLVEWFQYWLVVSRIWKNIIGIFPVFLKILSNSTKLGLCLMYGNRLNWTNRLLIISTPHRSILKIFCRFVVNFNDREKNNKSSTRFI